MDVDQEEVEGEREADENLEPSIGDSRMSQKHSFDDERVTDSDPCAFAAVQQADDECMPDRPSARVTSLPSLRSGEGELQKDRTPSSPDGQCIQHHEPADASADITSPTRSHHLTIPEMTEESPTSLARRRHNDSNPGLLHSPGKRSSVDPEDSANRSLVQDSADWNNVAVKRPVLVQSRGDVPEPDPGTMFDGNVLARSERAASPYDLFLSTPPRQTASVTSPASAPTSATTSPRRTSVKSSTSPLSLLLVSPLSAAR